MKRANMITRENDGGGLKLMDGCIDDIWIEGIEARTLRIHNTKIEYVVISNIHSDNLTVMGAALVSTIELRSGSTDPHNIDYARKRIETERRLREYWICQDRGHDPADIVLTSMPPQHVCKWCGTRWVTEPGTILEMDAP